MKYPYKKNKMAKQENKGDIFQSGTIKNKSTFIFKIQIKCCQEIKLIR